MTMIESQREARFAELADEWRSIEASANAVDEARFAMVQREAREIVDAGRWTSGPSDVLTILGRHRDELVHSRMLAWLLTPTGRHGLGRRFLRAFVAEVWPNDPIGELGTILLELETTRTGVSGLTGEAVAARADVVVHGDSVVIVIENKVDAGEQPLQCERLYWSWISESAETRWVYLTPTGRAPTSFVSAEARAAWHTASYGHVRRALERSLGALGDDARRPGHDAALQYLATLRAQDY